MLARFQLYAAPCKNEQAGYTTLCGPTFPLNNSLTESGACWDVESQSWLFPTMRSFEDFAETLGRADGMGVPGLREETAEFAGAAPANVSLRRFLDLGPNSLDDGELLEVLLSYDSYLSDPSSLSERLLEEFGSLGAILAAEPSRLARLDEVTPRARDLLRTVQLTLERVMHEPVKDNPVIGSWRALIDFLRARLQHRQVEELLVMYLDRRNRLIKTDSVRGTVDQVAVYPREIAARALELFAVAVILAHNHPSGDVTASKADMLMTGKVKTALSGLDIDLYDHVIVGHGSHLSFKAEGYL